MSGESGRNSERALALARRSLRSMLAEDAERFGEDGQEAAWTNLMHSISSPRFMQLGRTLVARAVDSGRAPEHLLARMRGSRTSEGRRSKDLGVRAVAREDGLALAFARRLRATGLVAREASAPGSNSEGRYESKAPV